MSLSEDIADFCRWLDAGLLSSDNRAMCNRVEECEDTMGEDIADELRAALADQNLMHVQAVVTDELGYHCEACGEVEPGQLLGEVCDTCEGSAVDAEEEHQQAHGPGAI